MARALINPGILQWAIDRGHIDLPSVADAVSGGSVERLRRWLSGRQFPTFVQARKLAQVLHVPFGYLYLDSPPTEGLPIPDLRTVGDAAYSEMSVDLHDVLSDVLRKHAWYREHLLELGNGPLEFVGKYEVGAPEAVVVADLVRVLGVSLADRAVAGGQEDFLGRLVAKAEAVGIWVMRNGVVGNNTHRPLAVEDFRGLAIADQIAPLVFVNGRDAKAAQVFTLVHELVHLWLGRSGVSDFPLASADDLPAMAVEDYCNRVAAEVLVPADAMQSQWDRSASPEATFFNASRYFRVSAVMIARRCLDLGLIDRAVFLAFYQQQQRSWQKAGSGGGNYYLSIPVRNGGRFTDAVLTEALAGRLLLREAGQLLDVTPAHLRSLAETRGV